MKRPAMVSEPSAKCSHLLVIGGGSAAFAAATRAAERGWRVTIVNHGLPIGGTCVNVGCIPSKALIRAAASLHRAGSHGYAGIESDSRLTGFGALFEQTSELVVELREKRYADVVEDLDAVRIIKGKARLIDSRHAEIDGQPIAADRILLATGARPRVPSIPGLDQIDFLTSDTAFALRSAPKSLIILGGRYIALECAQLFARLGVAVTVLQRSSRILPSESSQLTDALASCLRQEGIEIQTGVEARRVSEQNGQTRVEAKINGALQIFQAQRLLLATGRGPNTEELAPAVAKVATDADGFIQVDESLRTTVPGIYAAGDVIGPPMFVYAAAYEGALAAENATASEDDALRTRDYRPFPWVVFTDPQVAGVGMDLRQAHEAGIDAEAATLPMEAVPRAIVGRQSAGFLQLFRDRQSDRLIGARAFAHEGSELMMEVSLAIRHRMTVAELASLFHPYLTLSEAVKLAALSFDKDVNKLSCCAT